MHLKNNLSCMHLKGAVGEILSANEKVWIHKLPQDNPGLFDGFFRQSDENIFRTMWHGEFPGKLLTGIAQTYLAGNDPKTREIGDWMVEQFQKAQEPCGYLGPWSELVRFERDLPDRFESKIWGKWDTWGQYHCIYGLYRWYQVTGNKAALDVAIRALDHIYDHFIAGKISFAAQRWAECNFAVGHAFALFYEETGDERYLRAAEYIVKEDWKTEYFDYYTQSVLACDWMRTSLDGIPFYASEQPRWESLYSLETLAVLWRITGEREYMDAMESLWQGMRKTDRHNTGSFGTGEGATGNPYGAGSETCNTVAWMAFTTDYLKICGSICAADELELSFYNATLGSLMEGERDFTYMNDSNGKREPARTVLENHSYTGGRDMSCCQANGNRGLSQITEWAVLTGDDGVYLNYYGPCTLATALENGCRVTLSQQTDYPKTGNIRICVSADTKDAFTLYLRIPSWSEKTVVRLNGQRLESVRAGEYCAICRVWEDGDVVELELDMSIRLWVMNYEGQDHRVSAYHGPILLAFRTHERLRATTRFDRESLLNAASADGDGLVTYRAQSCAGQEVTFTDYYTAGKDGKQFVSWLVSPSKV